LRFQDYRSVIPLPVSIWTIVSPNGVSISEGETVPSIIDFTMVDTNKDATIDADEFKACCAAGWIAPAS
jgi:hypothetical protein